MVQLVKNPPAMWETWVQSLGWEDPLEKGKATHSIFWPGESHGLYSPWGRKELDTTEGLSLHSLGEFHEALVFVFYRRKLNVITYLLGIRHVTDDHLLNIPSTLLGFPGGSVVKNLPANPTGDMGSILGQEDALEEEMATHYSILAWEIPWTEEPNRLQSTGSLRLRCD